MACDVVMIAHEQDARDKKGNYTGKIRPLLTGQSADKIQCHYTDIYRQHAVAVNKADGKTWSHVEYKWQTRSDSVMDCKTSFVGSPLYVRAHYETFTQFQRKAG